MYFLLINEGPHYDNFEYIPNSLLCEAVRDIGRSRDLATEAETSQIGLQEFFCKGFLGLGLKQGRV